MHLNLTCNAFSIYLSLIFYRDSIYYSKGGGYSCMVRALKLILIKLLYFIKNFDKYYIILLRVFLRDVEKCQYSLQETRQKSHNTIKISVVDYVRIFDILICDHQNIL